MILYINNEHCSSVEQLKGYFIGNIFPDSDIYADLLDYGRYGDIAEWLREMGEPDMASRVDSISGDLSDSAFFSQLKAAILDTEIIDTGSLKPAFDKCFAFEGIKCEVKDNEAKVTVSLKVLMSVNEEYELCVSSNWGTRATMLNPYEYSIGKTISIDFVLHRHPAKELNNIVIKADNREINAFAVNAENKKVSNNGVLGKACNIDFEVNGISFKMIYVEGGCFTMGAADFVSEDEERYSFYSSLLRNSNPFASRAVSHDNELSSSQISLGNYYIGETVVTQALWEAVMGTNPSHYKGKNRPVEQVSWSDCRDFILKLNSLTGSCFRLPNEGEWEYAARGGKESKHTRYSGSNNLSEVAWYNPEDRTTHPVGAKKPNELGIYDMSGNVWEWCSDLSSERHSSIAQKNSMGSNSGSCHVRRGGSWDSTHDYCRLVSRLESQANYQNKDTGFRLALSTKDERKKNFKATMAKTINHL